MDEPLETSPAPRCFTLRRLWRHVPLGDAVSLLVVAGCAAAFAWSLFDALGDEREWRFGVVLAAFRAPAMFAAGKGMRIIDPGVVPELDAFYRVQTASVDVALIPDGYEGHPVTDSYSLMHYYLLYALGWTWRVWGISVWSIHLLCTVLFVFMAVVVYGIFRISMGRPLSTLGAVWMASAPAGLIICPSLRDFGKAPFILLAILLLGRFIARPQTGRSLMLWSAVLGLVAGIGYGFRQDLLICIPAGMAVVLFFVRLDGGRLFHRAAACLILLAVFLLVAWPVLRGVRANAGSASAQAFTQGVSEIMEDRMDFGHASYILHHHYSDYFDFTVVNAYARRTGDTVPMPGHFSAAHGNAGTRFMREVMRTFPADMFSRGLAGVWMLPAIPLLGAEETERVRQPHRDVLLRHARWHLPVARHLARYGLYYAAALLLCLCVLNLRMGAAFLFLVVYFGAYPSLLFEFRHFFHLAFIPYWIAGTLLSLGGVALLRLLSCLRGKASMTFRPLRALARVGAALLFLLTVSLATALVWVGLGIVQHRTVQALVSRYREAPLEPLSYRWERENGPGLLIPELPETFWEKTATLPEFETAGEYLGLELMYADRPIRFQLLYEDRPMVNFTQWARPHPGFDGARSGTFLFFFPVYHLAWPWHGEPGAACDHQVKRGRFRGIAFPDGAAQVTGVYRMTRPCEFSLWPFIAVPPVSLEDVVITRKSGPLERTVRLAILEATHLVDGDGEKAVRGLLDLMRQYPGSVTLENRLVARVGGEAHLQAAVNLAAMAAHAQPHLMNVLYATLQQRLQDEFSEAGPEDVVRAFGALREGMPHSPLAAYNHARSLEAFGAWEEALIAYEDALRLDPGLFEAANALDMLCNMHAQVQRRLEVWSALAQQHPTAPLPAMRHAIALYDHGSLEAAAAALRAVADGKGPHALEAELRLAALQFRIGAFDAALARMEALVETFPDTKGIGAYLCHIAGVRFMSEGRHALAERLFRAALAWVPEDLSRRVALGESLQAQGAMDQALREYEIILRAAPESPHTAHRLDSIYIEKGMLTERLRWWREMHDMHPRAAVPLLHLGASLEAAGDLKAAEQAYHQAEALQPESPEIQRRLQEFRRIETREDSH